MDALLSSRSIDISDLRQAPAKAIAEARDEAVVVLNHNRPVGYIVSTQLMGHIIEHLTERVIANKARQRIGSINKARKITLDML